MNKRERLLAASRRQPVDRIPIALWRHFPGDDQPLVARRRLPYVGQVGNLLTDCPDGRQSARS